MKKIYLIIYMFVLGILLCSCNSAKDNNDFCDVYMEVAYDIIGEYEIDDIVKYRDKDGGVLVVFTYYDEENLKHCYMAIQDFTFNLEKTWDEVTDEHIRELDGMTVPRGFFSVLDDYTNQVEGEYSYVAISTAWITNQASQDFDVKYNIEKINETIKNGK